MSAQAETRGPQPQDIVAVDEHSPDGNGRNRGGRGFQAGKIGDLETLFLQDDKPFRFESHPDLAASGGDAPYDFSRKDLFSAVKGAGVVVVELALGVIEDAHPSQRPDGDLAFRSEAKPGDFVVRDGVSVRFGMKVVEVIAGGHVEPVQTFLGADPYFLPGSQPGRSPVVVPDVYVGQYL